MNRPLLTSLIGAGLLFVAACSQSSGGSTPPANAHVALDVRADRMAGSTSTTFNLTASVLNQGLTLDAVAWEFGDGRSDSGLQTSVTYAAPGFYAVTATATVSDGRQQTEGVTITVMPDGTAATMAPGGTALPVKVGDVDGDGQVTLADAHKIVKHVRGIDRLTDPDPLLAADIDFDGAIDDHDVSLASRAVALDAELPESITPTTGAPGVRVNMISSHLLDANALVTLQIGAAQPFEPFRPLPGYATFLIPLNVQNADPLAPITAARIQVAVLADGTQVDALDFDLVPAPTGQGDPVDEAVAAVATLREQMRGLGAQLGTYAQEIGAAPEESALISALLLDSEDHIDAVNRELAAAVAALSPAARQAFGLVLNANGLQDVVGTAGTQPLTLATDDVLVDSICSFLQIADKVGKLDDALGSACAAISVLALFPGPQQAVLVPLAGLCQGFSLATATVGIINQFVPRPGNKLVVRADDTSLLPSETANIQVLLELSLAKQLCSAGLGKLEDYLKGELTKILMKRLPLAKAAHRILQRYQFNQRSNAMRLDFLKKIREAIENLIGRVLNLTGINSALESLRRKVCEWAITRSNGDFARLDPFNLLTALPAATGSLAYPGGGGATFTCDPQLTGSEVVTIHARRMVCAKPLIGEVKITCGSQGNLGICMGDNGTLLDDIFEVQVNGISVLTSSVPVRRICTTQELPEGVHRVDMIGRAAPDGIGTYFIEFTGGTVLSGPPRSGSNLSAGMVFTWSVRVGTL